MKIVMATGNEGKVKELKTLLKELDYEVMSLKDFENIEEVPETGTSFLENSVQKVTGYAKQVNCACVADDSGLCVDALNGAPGIYSARFAPSDKERCEKLLDLMKEENNRYAYFCCFATLRMPKEYIDKIKGKEKELDCQTVSDNIVACTGILEGEIAREMKGSNGFGFDPVFMVTEKGKHLAELSSEEKNAISHRGKAMRKIKKILEFVI